METPRSRIALEKIDVSQTYATSPHDLAVLRQSSSVRFLIFELDESLAFSCSCLISRYSVQQEVEKRG